MVNRYIKAFVIATIIFLSGLLLASYFSGYRIDTTLSKLDELALDLLEQKTTILYMENLKDKNGLCSFLKNSQPILVEKTVKLGQKLTILEEVNRLDPKVLEMKKQYTLLNIQSWINFSNIKKHCEEKINTILYFYTNKEKGCISCEIQGYELTSIVESRKYNILIFAIEAELLELAIVDYIKKQFNVNVMPTIIINERHKLEGFKKKEEIIKFLE